MMKSLLTKSAFLTVLACILFIGSASELQAQKRYRVSYKSEGFSPILEGAIRIPSNTYSSGYGLNLTLGYQFNSYFYAGIGTSLDGYDSDLFVPVFADFRYFFLEGQFTPFAFADVGYGIPIDVDENLGSGLMVNPGFGLKYFLTRTLAVNGSLGYRYQSMPIEMVDDLTGTTTTNPNYIQSFTIRIGLQF